MYKGYALVSLLKQVHGSDFTSSHIIYRDRAQVFDAAGAVKQNDGDAPLPEALQITGIALHRRNQHSLGALLLEYMEVVIFLINGVIRIAQDNDVPGLVGQILDAARNLGEERVGHIKHYQADVLTGASTQLACRAVAHEADFLDG
jgi:hypothetical protein